MIWHFSFIFFDPDVYPMDTAWFTGNSIRKRPLGYHAHDDTLDDEADLVGSASSTRVKGPGA